LNPRFSNYKGIRFWLRLRDAERLRPEKSTSEKRFLKFLCLTAADKNLTGFHRGFRFTLQKHFVRLPNGEQM